MDHICSPVDASGLLLHLILIDPPLWRSSEVHGLVKAKVVKDGLTGLRRVPGQGGEGGGRAGQPLAGKGEPPAWRDSSRLWGRGAWASGQLRQGCAGPGGKGSGLRCWNAEGLPSWTRLSGQSGQGGVGSDCPWAAPRGAKLVLPNTLTPSSLPYS